MLKAAQRASEQGTNVEQESAEKSEGKKERERERGKKRARLC